MKYTKRPIPPFESKPISSGRTVKDVYTLDIAPNGEQKLVKTGTVDIQAEINSHRNLCDVKSIIDRFTTSGELDKLHARGAYVDLTEMPRNLAEVHALLRKSEDIYNGMTDEMKSQYPTYEKFMANFVSLESMNSFLRKYASAPNVTKKEVEQNEADKK